MGSATATTWHFSLFRKLGVQWVAIVPQPRTATVMRSEGAGRPAPPKALAGMMAGNPSAAALWARNRRREVVGASGAVRVAFMEEKCGREIKIIQCESRVIVAGLPHRR